jgi:HPt (histidine-containing phosphotransfer) domain-containing protein
MLIEDYFTEAGIRLEELREAVAGSDAMKLRGTAHILKGSSANLGASRMAELCYELENRGESGAIEDAARLLDELKIILHRTRRAIDAEMLVS